MIDNIQNLALKPAAKLRKSINTRPNIHEKIDMYR